MPLLNIDIDESVVTAIMVASPDAIMLSDSEDRIIELNTAAEHIFGCSREEAFGSTLSELIIAPEDREEYEHIRPSQSLVEYRDTSLRLELNGLHAAGTTFPIELTIVSARTQRGALNVSFIRDISFRKAKDEQLRRVTARLTNMVMNLQGGVALITEQRRIELVNAELCAMFNINATPEELVGESSTQIIEDTISLLVVDPEGFQKRILELITKRQIALNDIIHLRNGRVLSHDYIPIYDNGVYLGSLNHFRDVTKESDTRKRWEKLLNLEELNKEIIRIFLQVDDADDAISQTLAMVGQLLDVSRTYVFRFRETERLLDNTYEWCAPNIKPEIATLQAIPFEQVLPSLFPMLVQDSVIAPYHISTLPADIRQILEPQGIQSLMLLPLYSGGRIEGFIGCDENRYPREWLPEEIASFRLTAESYSRALERQQTEQDLVEARDTALRTAQVRSKFVANMSHEIRTPMTGVLGMLELLNETQLDEDQREFAQTAFSSAERLLDIINDILDFSKLDAGFVVLEAEPFVLMDIANEVRSTLAMQRNHRAIDIRVDVAPDVPTRVKGDPTRLRQILMNLAGNAVKFTHKGFVEIRLRLVASQGDYARIRFEVADTGIGIDQSQIHSIFDSFIQVDGSITRKYGGTGLGLSITRQLVELMGGRIEVESVLGQGSVFRFDLTLPAVSPADSLAGLQQKTQFEALNILLIDEEPTSRYAFSQQLKRYLVNVTTADCKETAALLRDHSENLTARFDLIFIPEAVSDDLPISDDLPALTTTQSSDRIIILVDSTDTNQRNQLVRPVRHTDLYHVLSSAVITKEAETPAFDQSAAEAAVTVNTLQPGENNPVSVRIAKPELKRILLAEDYPLNAMLVSNALEQEPWKLDIVENGLQVLEQLENVKYDLVLMDIQMPVMNGLEATGWIRNSSTPYQSIPILALTASVMQEERDRYLQSGINEVIVKPFTLSYLRDTIRHWLDT
jgi:PAS domain S-box-containing protein